MSSITYPVTCNIGHSGRILNNDSELVSHRQSEHAGMTVDEFKAKLFAQSTSAVNPVQAVTVAPKSKAHESTYGEWGISSETLYGIKAEALNTGADISPDDIQGLVDMLSSKYAFGVSKTHLLLDLFVFILKYKATDNVESLGTVTLHAIDGTSKQEIPWTTFQESAIGHFSSNGKMFTFRRLIPSCEDLWWKMWNDKKITALDRLREHGTASSRKHHYPKSNEKVPAWVVVPYLFDAYLRPQDMEIRNYYMDEVARVNKSEGEIVKNTIYSGGSAKSTNPSTFQTWGAPLPYGFGQPYNQYSMPPQIMQPHPMHLLQNGPAN